VKRAAAAEAVAAALIRKLGARERFLVSSDRDRSPTSERRTSDYLESDRMDHGGELADGPAGGGWTAVFRASGPGLPRWAGASSTEVSTVAHYQLSPKWQVLAAKFVMLIFRPQRCPAPG
jgi:hypothetical protein